MPGHDELLRHMERLVATGDWDMIKPYLRAAERTQLPEAVIQARHAAGHCIACDRKPCSGCGQKNSLWCDVCWERIRVNCPRGMVVSGLAQIMQAMTRSASGPRKKPNRERCV